METMEKLRVDRARVKFGSNWLKGDSRNRGFQKSGFYIGYTTFSRVGSSDLSALSHKDQ